MKTLNALLIALFGLVGTNAPVQAQFPVFPDSDAVWVSDVFYGQDLTLLRTAYHLEPWDEDTLINGAWYSVLRYGYPDQGGGFAGGLRENASGQVYFYHSGSDSTYLLYDFASTVGDSMDVWVGDPIGAEPQTTKMFVDHIDTLLNDQNTLYKKIWIKSETAIQGGQGATQWWIEGVGGSVDLLSTPGVLGLDFLSGGTCMSHNDSIWPSGSPGVCDDISGVTQIVSGPSLIVFPNPSSAHFTIGSQKSNAITVYSSSGQELFQTTSSQIDLSDYPPGLYHAVVQTAQGVGYVRLMVVR